MRRLLAASCLLPLLAVPTTAPATAAQPALPAVATGVGKDLVPVANISYRNGSDLEFATVNGRDYAIAPAMGSGLRVIDITTPTAPTVTGFLGCNTSQNDVQVRGDLVLMGVDGASGGTCFTQAGVSARVGVFVISIANPAVPKVIGFVAVPQGAHNVTWHPGGRYAYTSDSKLTPYTSPVPGGQLQVIDLLDPTKPTRLAPISLPGNLMSTHDVTFNASGTRAYVAALTATFILNTTNPAAPTEIARIQDQTVNISHGADPTPDGRYLLVTDEQAGAIANGACNVGGVHVYDLLVEAAPVKVGLWTLDPTTSATATFDSGNLTCTAHVLDYSPTGAVWTNGNYAAGVRMVSGTSLLARPADVAWFTPDDANTWSAKTYKTSRYVFANDLNRGFDVYEWIPGYGAVNTRLPGAPLAFRASNPAPNGTYCFTR
ncbi:MAG TPA: hypothetical protein VNA20_08070 [Frankiaceae bacterium]|nr:hypothetical protein [Frankiaceae bacterium]